MDYSRAICWLCGQVGHISRDCSQNVQQVAPSPAAVVPPPPTVVQQSLPPTAPAPGPWVPPPGPAGQYPQ